MNDKKYRLHLMVCGGTACVSNKSFEIKLALQEEINRLGLADEILVVTTGCNGFCEAGPIIVVKPDDIFYHGLTVDDVPYLVEEHLLKGRPVTRLMYTPPLEKAPIPKMSDIGFFKKQVLVALRNRGLIDAEKIEDYIARDGYKAIIKALKEMTPEEIIEEIKQSGLRGRGGAGFPTGVKWELVKKAEGEPKYLICNGDEGDPGAYMDRSILESDPHSVLEGMIIGARAMGIHQGFIYIRNEYPLALKRVNTAIAQATEYGLLGEDILGTGFNFQVKVVRGAGAFVCGEETSLIHSIEGRLAEPRPRPPYPAQSGLWGKPTCINNVETWANVPVIINRGAKWFSSIGTKLSKGTKVFSVVGKVKNTGLVEVPMGLSLGEIIFDICGGIAGDRKFKAVQIGGPSGGCIPRQLLNLPVDYEALTKAGAMMGSGGMVVTDENTCMVDMAHYFLSFVKDESCGKCTPCREGVYHMLNILAKVKRGEAEDSDLELLEEMAQIIKETALCGLGKTAPNPVLTTLRYFRDEYEAHIHRQRCPAGTCIHLVTSPCQNACPIDTEVSSYVALIANRKFKEALRVNEEVNPLPSVCARVCHHPCEIHCRLGEIDKPVAIRGLKRFLTDYRSHINGQPSLSRAPSQDKKVAIIGSGPAGLMAAWKLALLGYQPTVFEAESVPGGMLAWGIPDYRLPKDVLQQEIKNIANIGVKFQLNTRIGHDISLEELQQNGYQAIFIATGCPQNLKMGIPGEDLPGVVDPLAFLKSFNLTGQANIGQKVIVVGGGNTALDAARTAWRLGAEVTILYRRTRTEMPAIPEEVEEAIREGIKIEFLTLPIEALAENGHLARIKCLRMQLGEFDDSGRRRPLPIDGSEFIIEADTLIPAIGQKPDLTFANGASPKVEFKVTKWGTLQVDPETMATNIEGIFAGGDLVLGPATVLEAMRTGKIAAESIDRYLKGETLTRTYHPLEMKYEVPLFELTPEQAFALKPQAIPTLKPEERAGNFREVELGFTEEQAVEEAKRCLRCDIANLRMRGEIT